MICRLTVRIVTDSIRTSPNECICSIHTETALKTQWQAVQDKYQRERKLAKKSNSVSQWPLLESLEFLKQSSKSQSKQQRLDESSMCIDNAALASASSSSAVGTNNSTPNHQHLHHHAVVIVSAPSADNTHSEVVATYSTNVGLDDSAGGMMSASGSRKRRRDSNAICDGDDGDDDDGGNSGNGAGSTGSGLERKIERIVKRIVTRDGAGTSNNSGNGGGGGSTPHTYEEEFFSKYICEKLKSFPKKLRADAKSHIFQYLHELDNTLQ